jgi:cytochrome b subunit of formate dehydrogenase/nitrate/TMAO reductase-like tetraheme cytochrome c subunit
MLSRRIINRLLNVLAAPALLLCVQQTHAQANADCLACHGERTLTMEKKGTSVSLFVDGGKFSKSAHADLQCVSCHEGFNASAIPHARHIKPVDCLSCHGDQEFLAYARSVHAAPRHGTKTGPAAACYDCHSPHAIERISTMQVSQRQQFALETCARCHGDVYQRYMKSDHGLALTAGAKGAPSCIDCHGEHEVASPSSDSAQTSHRREAEMCLRCHLDKPEVRDRVGLSAGFISSYENSVHAKAVRSGNDAAATCTDCHGSHEMKKGSNPDSRVSKTHIASTCGRCHGDVEAQYEGSIHGVALAKGISASATCTDCHGEHNILSPRDASSPVAARNVSAQVCSPCHASVRLTQKYGLAADRFQSFSDSYHGLAGRAGSVEVANCASCHGVHDIKPSSDPSSRISRENLVKTCGTCHPGANQNFTKGAVHVVATSGQENILYLVSSGYIVLIVMIIGGMFIHNVLDFVRKARTQLLHRRGMLPRHRYSHRLYTRMSLSERIQHGTLLVSFAVLVFTGFALKFPDAWWVVPIRNISPVMFALRGLLHRAAAVVLVAASLYHLYYITMVPRGKRLLRDLLPVRQDITDAVAVLKYNMGISQQKPQFGRFSYIEKSEYWALLWGTFVMAVTGVILWFDNTFLGLLTKLGWDVARTIHYYEAWLATLAIIVWHFYFVVFNPNTYPINLAFWKGTLTEEEMADEHPLELEKLERDRKKAEATELADANPDHP